MAGCSGRWRERDALAAVFERAGAQGRFEGLAVCPGGGINGLAVVVGVENYGALGVQGGQFAEDDWAASGDGEKMSFDAASFEHGDEVLAFFWMLGVSLAMLGMARNSVSSRMMRSSLFMRKSRTSWTTWSGLSLCGRFGWRRNSLRGNSSSEDGGEHGEQ